MAEYQQLCEGIETLDDLKYEPRHVTEARRDATLEAIRALQAVEQFARAHAANPDRPFPTPYSPECVEEAFSEVELPLYAVLGSPVGRASPDAYSGLQRY